MKKFCYSIIGLFVIVLVSSCSNGSKVLQSPEDAVRERYGLPWQTEEEYEAACKSNRKFQGLTPFTELQEWSKYYYEEDAGFEEKVKQYDMINNTLQKLAFGVMYNKGNDENAMKKLLIESGYGDNEEQCKALIEGLKKDGFLMKELNEMRLAHRKRIMAEITPLCESLNDEGIAFQAENREGIENNVIKEAYVTAKPKDYEIQPGQCPFNFYIKASMLKDVYVSSCSIYNKTFLMHEDGEDFISGIIGFEDLRLFPFITGKLVTFRYF